jgi:hypothetical protein
MPLAEESTGFRMRRLIPILLLIAVMMASALPSAASAEERWVPHENPATAEESVDAIGLLLFYGEVLEFLSSGDTTAVQKLLVEKFQHANVPPDIRFIVQRYNDLLRGLSSTLGSLQTELERASQLLSQGQLAAAGSRLDEASQLLSLAEDMLKEVSQATEALASHPLLGVFVAPEGSGISLAYTRLTEMLTRVRELETQLEDLFQSLERELSAAQEKEEKPTLLTLGVNPSQAWVGDSVTVSGGLVSLQEGKGLPGREVEVVVGGDSFVATTAAGGIFSLEIEAISDYVPEVGVQAFYRGTGDKYQPSSSPVVKLEVSLYPTLLTLELDTSEAWVGDSVSVSGKLTSPREGKGLPGREVEIVVGGDSFVVTTAAGGFFSREIEIAYYLSPLALQAVYTPAGEDAERYSASSSPPVELEVLSYSTTLTLEVSPSQAWVGDSVTISGALLSPEEGTPLPGREIEIIAGGNSFVATTAAGGIFSLEIEAISDYVPEVGVQAFYRDTGDKYQPSSSPVVRLTVSPRPTTLTLEINPAEAWVGDSVELSGKLTSRGEAPPLSGKQIEIDFAGKFIPVVTEEDGSYRQEIEIPYYYVSSLAVQARYIPQDEDKRKFLPAFSPAAVINLKFYRTSLEVEVPQEAYPGQTLLINGRVTSIEDGSPQAERKIDVLLDGELLGRTTTDLTGLFELVVPLEPQLAPGEHSLVVHTRSRGVYAAASWRTSLSVVKLVPQIDIPTLVFLTMSREVHISGRVASLVSSSADAEVAVKMMGISRLARTSTEGDFAVTLRLPSNAVLLGPEKLSIEVNPREPWHLPLQVETSIFVVDLANLGLVSLALISAGVVVYTRRRSMMQRGRFEPVQLAPLLLEREEGISAPATEARFRKIEEGVLKAYVTALSRIEEKFTTSLEPQMTLREFSHRASRYLGDTAEAFTELTRLAEKVIYSPYRSRPEEVARAETLALRIRESVGEGR